MAIVGSFGSGAGSGGTSVPRWTTRVFGGAERCARASVPAELASTSRALASARVTAVVAAGAADDRQHVAAVDGDDERRAGPRAPHGVTGRRGVVGVDEVEGEARAAVPQRQRKARRRPRAPAAVGARARRREERDVGDLDAVERGVQRLAQRLEELLRLPLAQRRLRGHRAVQDEHPHVGAGVARGQRLAVRPDAEHRVGGARVVLGDDDHAHAVSLRQCRDCSFCTRTGPWRLVSRSTKARRSSEYRNHGRNSLNTRGPTACRGRWLVRRSITLPIVRLKSEQRVLPAGPGTSSTSDSSGAPA